MRRHSAQDITGVPEGFVIFWNVRRALRRQMARVLDPPKPQTSVDVAPVSQRQTVADADLGTQFPGGIRSSRQIPNICCKGRSEKLNSTASDPAR